VGSAATVADRQAMGGGEISVPPADDEMQREVEEKVATLESSAQAATEDSAAAGEAAWRIARPFPSGGSSVGIVLLAVGARSPMGAGGDRGTAQAPATAPQGAMVHTTAGSVC
jgi:hypothetical protein